MKTNNKGPKCIKDPSMPGSLRFIKSDPNRIAPIRTFKGLYEALDAVRVLRNKYIAMTKQHTKPYRNDPFVRRNELKIVFVKMHDGWHVEMFRQGHLLFVGVVYPDFPKCLKMTRNLIDSLQNKHFTLERSDGKDTSLYGTT